MLQVDICPFASDALEDAMRLAQTKSLNSYTFSDCLNFLNYVWSDIYSQICCIDSGYYSKTVKLTSKLTKLPRFVKNSVRVYSAQRPLGYDRRLYRASGDADLTAPETYHISGTDLYCPDAERRSVWLEYCPQPQQIFFTHHNRDPKIYPDGHETVREKYYSVKELKGYIGQDQIDLMDLTIDLSTVDKWVLEHRNTREQEDITNNIIIQPDGDGQWLLKFISCDYPYIFCSYQHNVTGEWKSGFFDKALEWTDYNPFEWTGRNDNVEYICCKYNDKTGLGVIVKDHNDIEEKLLNTQGLPYKCDERYGVSIIHVLNDFEYKGQDGVTRKFTPGYWYNRHNTDYNYEECFTERPDDPDEFDVYVNDGVFEVYKNGSWETIDLGKYDILTFADKVTGPRVKELGWTPDTKLVYPAPEVYRYLVARLAEKFAALNESNIMGVQSELVDARFAFQAFLKKDKSAWERMRNVNPATVGDWL